MRLTNDQVRLIVEIGREFLPSSIDRDGLTWDIRDHDNDGDVDIGVCLRGGQWLWRSMPRDMHPSDVQRQVHDAMEALRLEVRGWTPRAPDTVCGDDVAVAALSMQGTTYQHQGRLPVQALDCAGLVICTARQLGIVAPTFDIAGYTPTASATSIPDECDKWMRRVEQDDLRPGDVLCVNVESEGNPQHLGIIYRHPYSDKEGRLILGLVHASIKRKRVVAAQLVFSRTMQFVAAWRMVG